MTPARYIIPRTALFFAAMVAIAAVAVPAIADPLPSWEETDTKKAIMTFVERVTTPGSPDYVDPAERIAVFDNDGTLWVEQPMYTQIVFSIDRVQELAPQHPAWKNEPPFSLALTGNEEALLATGDNGLQAVMNVPNAGLTEEQYDIIAGDWLASARHPRFYRPYTELLYQPMLELLAWLRAEGFKTFIVSGGGIEFMRVFSESAYGIPPEQIVGSSVMTEFRMGADGKPEILRDEDVEFIDNGPGKAVGIAHFIGRRPIFAFGNSDGDLEMLEWTAAGDGARFMGLVHHTDPVREYAYDRKSSVGRLDKALDAAIAKGWTVADMKTDWRRVFPFED